jgi:hypothetical protein
MPGQSLRDPCRFSIGHGRRLRETPPRRHLMDGGHQERRDGEVLCQGHYNSNALRNFRVTPSVLRHTFRRTTRLL